MRPASRSGHPSSHPAVRPGRRHPAAVVAGSLALLLAVAASPAGAASGDPEEPYRRAAAGDSLFAMGEIDAASVEYEAAYESARSFQAGTDPREEGQCLANYGRARVALERGGDPKEAEKLLKSCKDKQQYVGRYHLGMGLTRYKQGKLEEAEKLLIKGASRMDAQAGEGVGFVPVRREIGESLIEIAIANEEPLMAATYIDEMVAVSPPEEAARLLVHKGTIYVDHRMYDEALEAYGQAMGADSSLVDAYRLSAQVFYRDEQGKYNAQAAMTLGRMARANPTAPNYVEAGDAWLKANQAANALTAFEAAVELDPQSAPAQLGLARSSYLTGERERAAEIYQSIGDRSGFTAEDYDMMGRALQEQRKYPEAREAYIQAFERDSTNTDALFYIAYTHFAMREWAEAIPYFERRIAIDSTSVAAFVNLGLAYWQTDKVKRGVEMLRTAVELQPENTRNRLWYAQILAADGQFGEAVSQYQMALEEEPEDAEAWRSLGFCLLNRERFGEAVNALNKADRLEPGNAQTLLWLAQGYGLMAELDKAEETFRRVLKINPNSKEAQQGIEMIQQSKKGKGKRRKASSS